MTNQITKIFLKGEQKLLIKSWEELPSEMQNEEIRVYYDFINGKKKSLIIKRIFDICGSFILLILFFPFLLITALIIKSDSPGPIFFRQVRITQYGEKFKIFKFRTMISDADKLGPEVTANNDSRVTRAGKILRKYRIDEIPQLLNVLNGTMTFVGVRPEVEKYVNTYTPLMRATLLIPAGVTNITSIYFRDESYLINNDDDVDKVYVEKILPKKMKYNLQGIKSFSVWNDIKIIFMTVAVIVGGKYGVLESNEGEEI